METRLAELAKQHQVGPKKLQRALDRGKASFLYTYMLCTSLTGSLAGMVADPISLLHGGHPQTDSQ